MNTVSEVLAEEGSQKPVKLLMARPLLRSPSLFFLSTWLSCVQCPHERHITLSEKQTSSAYRGTPDNMPGSRTKVGMNSTRTDKSTISEHSRYCAVLDSTESKSNAH